MGALEMCCRIVEAFALVFVLFFANCTAIDELSSTRVVQNYTFGERIDGDYKFYEYSECNSYNIYTIGFTKCTRFSDPRNVTYAHFLTNKTTETEKMYISKGGIGEDMVEFCFRVENPRSYCISMQFYGFENDVLKS